MPTFSDFSFLISTKPIAFTMVYYIKSQRGSNKLVDDNNYIYNFHRQTANKSRTVWLCEVKVCRARVHTKDPLEIVSSSGEHSHSADVTKLKSRIALSAIKEKALSSHEAARSVIATECSSLQDAMYFLILLYILSFCI